MKTLFAHDSSLSTLTEKDVVNDSKNETRFGEHLLCLLINLFSNKILCSKWQRTYISYYPKRNGTAFLARKTFEVNELLRNEHNYCVDERLPQRKIYSFIPLNPFILKRSSAITFVTFPI